jgi:hypothetical protein
MLRVIIVIVGVAFLIDPAITAGAEMSGCNRLKSRTPVAS